LGITLLDPSSYLLYLSKLLYALRAKNIPPTKWSYHLNIYIRKIKVQVPVPLSLTAFTHRRGSEEKKKKEKRKKKEKSN
jgi:hypothetical protein